MQANGLGSKIQLADVVWHKSTHAARRQESGKACDSGEQMHAFDLRGNMIRAMLEEDQSRPTA